MIETHLTYFDAAVITVMGLSCLFALFRGFVKEILSLSAWVGAGIVTIYFFQDVAKMLAPHVKKNPEVAAGMAALGLYVVSLMLFSILNGLILRLLKEGSDIGPLDNLLGLLFGGLRGAFMVSLAYLVITMTLSEEEYPDWLKKSETKPYVEKGAMLLAKAAPHYLQEMTSLKEKALERAAKQKAKEKDVYRQDDTQMLNFMKNITKSETPDAQKPAPETGQ